MSNSWRFFFVVELLLGLFAMWQLTSDYELLFLFFIGCTLLYFTFKMKPATKRRALLGIIGGIILYFSLMNSSAIWLMLIFAIIYIGIKGIEISGWSLGESLKKKKQVIFLETEEPQTHNGQVRKQSWFGNERIGNVVYEWDDINLNLVFGDTLIDLGNTLLPKKDNIVMIRKGFGRTRVLVPLGVGVQMEHATFMGNVLFEEKKISLNHETVTVYSDEYDDANRRIKIISSCLIGDIEVIRI